MLDQSELDALFDTAKKDETAKASEPDSGDGMLDQNELDALFDTAKADTKKDKKEDDVDWASAFAEAAEGGDAAAAEAMTKGQHVMDDNIPPPVSPADAAPAPFPPDDTQDENGDEFDLPHLQFILELPLELSVEIGRTVMTVKSLLQQSQGSVIELNKDADEPIEIFVAKKFMAKGEVVVVEDNFAVRIDDIVSQAERVKSLGA
ncbi:flagellar motor switch protein FliN/FliY [Candidatus Magnetomoraceae bacterium gMMP-15]